MSTKQDAINETLAINSVNNFQALKLRLKHAKSTLNDKYIKLFSIQNKYIDFTNKRLVSKCGQFCLQWQTRLFPDVPVNYNNQQTTGGCVILIKIN